MVEGKIRRISKDVVMKGKKINGIIIYASMAKFMLAYVDLHKLYYLVIEDIC